MNQTGVGEAKTQVARPDNILVQHQVVFWFSGKSTKGGGVL